MSELIEKYKSELRTKYGEKIAEREGYLQQIADLHRKVEGVDGEIAWLAHALGDPPAAVGAPLSAEPAKPSAPRAAAEAAPAGDAPTGDAAPKRGSIGKAIEVAVVSVLRALPAGVALERGELARRAVAYDMRLQSKQVEKHFAALVTSGVLAQQGARGALSYMLVGAASPFADATLAGDEVPPVDLDDGSAPPDDDAPETEGYQPM
jgi:hypothetical protein